MYLVVGYTAYANFGRKATLENTNAKKQS